MPKGEPAPAADTTLGPIRDTTLGPYDLEWLLQRVADYGAEAPGNATSAWKADAAPTPLQLLIPEMILLERQTPQVLFFTDCAGFLRAARRPLKKEPYVVYDCIAELIKQRQQADWNSYREVEAQLEKAERGERFERFERAEVGRASSRRGSRNSAAEEPKVTSTNSMKKQRNLTGKSLVKNQLAVRKTYWKFWAGSEQRMLDTEVANCFKAGREWPTGATLLQASFWTGVATPRPKFITYNYNALQTEAKGAIHDRLTDIMDNHFERYRFLEAVRDRNEMSAVPVQLAQHLTYYCNIELVSGEFVFFKDRKSQLWLADARNLICVPSVSRFTKSGGAPAVAAEQLPQKMFRYLSEEALQNVLVEERDGPKCQRMFELMIQDYQAMKQKFGVDSMLRKVQQELDTNVPILEGTDVDALSRAFDIQKDRLGTAATATPKRQFSVPPPQASPVGRCRWFTRSSGSQVRASTQNKGQRHGSHMSAIIERGRQEAWQAEQAESVAAVSSKGPKRSFRSRSKFSYNASGDATKTVVPKAQAKIEIVTTAVAQELLVGAGTGVCPEGDTMDMLRPSISKPGHGLQMTRKAAVPCARAVVVPQGAHAQAEARLKAADQIEQEIMFAKFKEQWESENRETRETREPAPPLSTPRDREKTLRTRSSVHAGLSMSGDITLTPGHSGSKGSATTIPHKAPHSEEPMDMPMKHKLNLLECSAGTCWCLKAGSKSTRKRPETPDSD